MLFKELIRKIRITANLSKMKLADCLNYTESSITCYERGERKPQLKTAKKAIDFANKIGIKVSCEDIEDII